MSGTPEFQLAYVLAVLKNATEFKADYHGVATQMNIASANNAQKRFKAIVESSGQYKLVAGKIVDAAGISGSGSTAATAVTTPAATPATAPATPKKRKAKNTGSTSTTPATPASKRARKRAATPAPLTKPEDDDELAKDNDDSDVAASKEDGEVSADGDQD